jgi:ATP-binding cassette subfamily B protein
VDVETERQIHQAMVEVMRGRTTFVIAHRLSTVQQADHIVVLDKGRVAEHGTHGQLYANAGIYRNIFDLQLRPQEELMLDVALAAEVGGDC